MISMHSMFHMNTRYISFYRVFHRLYIAIFPCRPFRVKLNALCHFTNAFCFQTLQNVALGSNSFSFISFGTHLKFFAKQIYLKKLVFRYGFLLQVFLFT